MLNLTQKLRFFTHRCTSSIKNHQRAIENTTFGIGIGLCIYYYPALTEQWIMSQMLLLTNQLSEKEKQEIAGSPEKRQEFVEACKREIQLSLRYD